MGLTCSVFGTEVSFNSAPPPISQHNPQLFQKLQLQTHVFSVPPYPWCSPAPPEHSILLSKMPASSYTQSDPANVSKDGREVPVREACANCQSYGKLSRALEYSQSTPVLCPLFVTLSKRGLHCYLFMHKFYFFSIWKTCGNRHHRF